MFPRFTTLFEGAIYVWFQRCSEHTASSLRNFGPPFKLQPENCDSYALKKIANVVNSMCAERSSNGAMTDVSYSLYCIVVVAGAGSERLLLCDWSVLANPVRLEQRIEMSEVMKQIRKDIE